MLRAIETVAVPTLTDAAATFGNTFHDGTLANDIAPKLTCAEVDALVRLLLAAGLAAAADLWLNAHAADDEEGDTHYQDIPRDQHRPRSWGCALTFEAAKDTGSPDGPCPTCEPFAFVTDDDLAAVDAAAADFEHTLDTNTTTR